MRLAVVVHRYGSGIRGGAEAAARELAVRMAERPGVEVEVFTTCATDTDWTQGAEPGTSRDGAATVHRFRSEPRHPGFHDFSTALFRDTHPSTVAEADAERWLTWQGPSSPDLVEAVAASGADVVTATPYLYRPTVDVVRRLGERVVLHPATHDELPIHLPAFREVFCRPGGLVFFSDAERRVAERLFPVAARPQAVVGVGVEVPDVAPDPAVFADGAGRSLHGRPYLLYVGRVDDGKGTGALAELFAAYKRRRPGPLALALVGPVVHAPAPHPDLVVAGPVSEEEKWSALAGATAFVHPSAFESFSIVLMEAWAAGRPAVVNARCDVTVEHARRSGGGLPFRGYGEFEAIVDRLVAEPSLAAGMGAAGRHYVGRHFAWPHLLDRYETFLRARC